MYILNVDEADMPSMIENILPVDPDARVIESDTLGGNVLHTKDEKAAAIARLYGASPVIFTVDPHSTGVSASRR